MNEELKTLNDFLEKNISQVNLLSSGNYEGLTYFKGRLHLIEELKEEAVKWVKLYSKLRDKATKSLDLVKEAYFQGKIDATMKQNSISEEILK